VAKKWLSVAEVAEELGLSDDTIRNWVNRKKNPLPAIKTGRDWRIKREDLDIFLEHMKNVREDEDEKP
jgi:excisionase family DNA binding protein